MCIINEKEKKQAPQAIIIDPDNQCAPLKSDHQGGEKTVRESKRTTRTRSTIWKRAAAGLLNADATTNGCGTGSHLGLILYYTPHDWKRQGRMTTTMMTTTTTDTFGNVLHLLWNGVTHQRHDITRPIFPAYTSHLLAPVPEQNAGQRVVTLYFLSFRESLLCCRAVAVVRCSGRSTCKQVLKNNATARLLTMKRCPELASGISKPMSARIACPLVVASYSKSLAPWAGGTALAV